MSTLTDQERAVLDAIAADPFAGQQAIADRLGMPRSTVAAHIAQLVRKGRLLGRAYVLAPVRSVLVIGGAVVDRKYRAFEPVRADTSNPVSSGRTFGGVGRNVAEQLARAGIATRFASAVGDDDNGRALLAHLKAAGADVSGVAVLSGAPTAEYVAVLEPDGSLHAGLADMAIFDRIAPADLDRLAPAFAASDWVFFDANLPARVLAAIVERGRRGGCRIAADAVSVAKARKLPGDLTGIDLLFLNRDEAHAVLGETEPHGGPPERIAEALVARGAAAVVLTLGAAGLVIARRASPPVRVAAEPAAVVDVTGAGDALVAGTLARLVAGDDLVSAAAVGARLAALTVAGAASVHPTLGPELLEDLALAATAAL